MSMDLTGITNQNEYYTNHYFSSIFEENAADTISQWRTDAKENEESRTPWALLRDAARQYYPIHDRFLRSKFDMQSLGNIRLMADTYLAALGYPKAEPEWVVIDEERKVPVYLELKKSNGAPILWVILAASEDKEAAILDKYAFIADDVREEGPGAVTLDLLTSVPNEDLVTQIFFGQQEPPRFVILIGMNQIALIDRNKWNEKRYLQFELEEIFSRHEESTLQAMAVLLHKNSLCPEDGTALIDELDSNSQKHAAGVSQDLKYALRESIELLGNEVLYDMAHRQDRDLEADPVDAGQLTLECLRYMYRMLFVLFIESRPELGYAPIKAQSYLTGYSLESLRDIADAVRDDISEVGSGYYLHETLSKLYDLIYSGYPGTEEEILKYSDEESLHDMFVIAPLKAHIFDPEFTKMITNAKIRNSVMLRIIDLMSLTRETGRRNARRGRISYANLGINQMGSVYEALLSYRGFIAEHTLFEVKRADDKFNELDVGYFVAEEELGQYTEDERVRYEKDDPDGRYKKGDLRRYEKGTFIYRLAGREREKSASYYTPEVLTKCLVKYALKELLEGKTADDILQLTICEPAMGSAAFLNEAINQLAEAYLDRRQKERGEMIPADKRQRELQKVKMYIADRNVYGIDLNPVAVELAEVSLWLNTIYDGGYVPWFGTQLVNGNSLIGARRQCYRVENLTTKTKGLRWFENAPERVPVGAERADKNYQKNRKQIYHFLLGDPGMCAYSDNVIKSLEPENLKKMAAWNKKFNEPYSDDDIASLLRLSDEIDKLWNAQVKLRQEVEGKTRDRLSIYGWEDEGEDSHTTIRQKDRILSELYKSEHMRNAGPYARLKFAMDYWCALWFWPIDKADLLPSRSEFFFDMAYILSGTMGAVNIRKGIKDGQMTFLATENELMAQELLNKYGIDTVVDIPLLRKQNPRLDLAYQIAEQNHFMHWELEFADLFDKKGGFDLIIGNPPWIKLKWNEQSVLADIMPLFLVKKLSAFETTNHRDEVLEIRNHRKSYFEEYESISGQMNFLVAFSNYPILSGQQPDLFKCFMPQAWYFSTEIGISAFVHPEGVYDDPKGGELRNILYSHLCKHFQFQNELALFSEVAHQKRFSINIYSNKLQREFESISNLYTPQTIDLCYENPISNTNIGVKDENGNWNIEGNADRILHIGKNELLLFARIFENNDNWQQARIPLLHTQSLIDVLSLFAFVSKRISLDPSQAIGTALWHETNAQKDNIIQRNVHFPNNVDDVIYSGPHIGVANPLYKTSRAVCIQKSDFDLIDLEIIDDKYLPRGNYSPKCTMENYLKKVPMTSWGNNYLDNYRVVSREMANRPGERTLIAAIYPPHIAHILTQYGVAFSNINFVPLVAGSFASIPFDFFIKSTGKAHINGDTIPSMPLLDDTKQTKPIILRALLLNCLTKYYDTLWHQCWDKSFLEDSWAKSDPRLNDGLFSNLSPVWNKHIPIKSEYARRQALVELDVLVSMALNMTLEQLKTIYRIQFPVLQSYESDTWYDANGRIVFSNRGMGELTFKRPEWENGIKGAPAGKKFYRTITDDTMPGGPIQRTIEYVAPFDRCDREQDYETAWKFFEEKYGSQVSGERYQVSEPPSKSETENKRSEINQNSAALAAKQPDNGHTSSTNPEYSNRSQSDNRQPKENARRETESRPPANETRREPEAQRNAASRNSGPDTSQKPVFGQPPKKPKQEPLVSKPAREEQAGQSTFLDYSMYRCPLCSKLVMSYDRPSHESKFHPGKVVNWKKVG